MVVSGLMFRGSLAHAVVCDADDPHRGVICGARHSPSPPNLLPRAGLAGNRCARSGQITPRYSLPTGNSQCIAGDRASFYALTGMPRLCP